MSEDDTPLGYADGFANRPPRTRGLALTARRRQLERGVRWRFAVDALKEFWLTELWQWADEGDGEFPPGAGGVLK